MARTTPRLRGSTISPRILYEPPQWADIDATLRDPLSDVERQAIRDAAERYLMFAEAEAKAPSVTNAQDALTALTDATSKMISLLAFADPKDAVRHDALNQLNSMFLDLAWRVTDSDEPVNVTHDMWNKMTAFRELCGRVRSELECLGSAGGGYPSRAAFASFIASLKSIYEARNLTATAPKESARKCSDSAFVRFCRAVYLSLPDYNTNPRGEGDTAFSEAVAKAIGRRPQGSNAGRKNTR